MPLLTNNGGDIETSVLCQHGPSFVVFAKFSAAKFSKKLLFSCSWPRSCLQEKHILSSKKYSGMIRITRSVMNQDKKYLTM